jgi:protein O-mannosyl-transferase
VQREGSWAAALFGPYWPAGTSLDRLYRPVTLASFRLNALVIGGTPQPWAFHAVNLVLHAVVSAAVALLAARATGSPIAAFLAGGLFATAPVHTEAVVTAYGRSELLAAAFGALLLARHVTPPPTRPPRARARVGEGFLFLAAVLAKEHALLLWPGLVLLDVHHARADAGGARTRVVDLARRHAGYALAAGLALALRVQALGPALHLDRSATRVWDNPMAQAGPIEQLLMPLRLFGLAAELLVRPSRLVPIWSYPSLRPPTHVSWDVAAGAALLVAVVLATTFLWRRRSILAPLLAATLILLSLPLHALPFAQWVFAERWLYLPTVPLAVVVAAGLVHLGRPGVVAGLAAVLAGVPASVRYARDFRDDVAMNERVVRAQPDSFHGRRNLAIALLGAGRHADAVREAEEAIRRHGVSDPYYVLIQGYLALGDGARALAALETFLRLNPQVPAAALHDERRRALELLAAQSASRPP